ncbi:hypothetical protein VaNZ11_004022 [Volvox africanus]|uniref:Uncharacterized protein n=1 Tax=Volvox africanus TaxID=51714 RepID=A0ABQ5RVZ7_9CHLO|nr:hypothetical protein VaNZ11_004022 [Volvox africanus]
MRQEDTNAEQGPRCKSQLHSSEWWLAVPGPNQLPTSQPPVVFACSYGRTTPSWWVPHCAASPAPPARTALAQGPPESSRWGCDEAALRMLLQARVKMRTGLPLWGQLQRWLGGGEAVSDAQEDQWVMHSPAAHHQAVAASLPQQLVGPIHGHDVSVADLGGPWYVQLLHRSSNQVPVCVTRVSLSPSAGVKRHKGCTRFLRRHAASICGEQGVGRRA